MVTRNSKGQFVRRNPKFFVCIGCDGVIENKRGKKLIKYCSPKCYHKSRKGENKLTIECGVCREQFKAWLSDNRKYCSEECASHTQFSEGQESWNRGKNIQTNTGKTHFKKGHEPWNKGIGNPTEAQKVRSSALYREWRKAVFIRDDYTCQSCMERGGKLHADHIKPFSVYKDLRVDIDNGRTLCVECHKKTDSFAGKVFTNYRTNT